MDTAELAKIRQWLAPEQPERFLEARAAIAEGIESLQAAAAGRAR